MQKPVSFPELEPVPSTATFYWLLCALLASTFIGGAMAMLLFTPEVAAAAAERLHDALFYVERV